MNRTRLALFGLGAVALVWRAAVLVDPMSSPLLSDEPTRGELNLLFARSVMGLVFFACGALVLLRLRTKRSAVFSLYAFCAAIHWGGPVAAGEEFQTAVWLLYFLVSAMLAEAAFLHFTLVFPEPWTWAPRHRTRIAIYFPVVLGAIAAGLALGSDVESGAAQSWLDKFMLLEVLQANLFALAGLLILVVRFVRAGPLDGPRAITGAMAFGAWLSVLPWVLAMALESQGASVPGGADVYTLFFVLMPLVLTWALLRHVPSTRQ
jgi:hypothetical protein